MEPPIVTAHGFAWAISTDKHGVMPYAPSSDIQLYYETFGDASDPGLLLVCGWSVQMLSWDAVFCQMLADQGLFVIRFDNRDVGLSTHLDGVDVDLAKAFEAVMAGERVEGMPYTLEDMARDGFAILDHLAIGTAAIAGASMGGMIVQTMALMAPQRVNALVSIMSTTGEIEFGQSDTEAAAALGVPPPATRDDYIEHIVRLSKVICSKTMFEEDRIRRRAGASFDRSFDPTGPMRQAGAMVASPPRAERLRTLRVPTLVIHGRQDPLITLSGGERTAELIPGAELLVLDDMAHDLPSPLWPQIVTAIAKLAGTSDVPTPDAGI